MVSLFPTVQAIRWHYYQDASQISKWKILGLNLAASRLHEILPAGPCSSFSFVSHVDTVPASALGSRNSVMTWFQTPLGPGRLWMWCNRKWGPSGPFLELVPSSIANTSDNGTVVVPLEKACKSKLSEITIKIITPHRCQLAWWLQMSWYQIGINLPATREFIAQHEQMCSCWSLEVDKWCNLTHLRNTMCTGGRGLLHIPSLMAIGLSVGYVTWPAIGWHHPFVIDWYKDRLGLPSSPLHYGFTWPVGIPTVIQTPVTVPLYCPNGRQLPAVRTVQGDCERVYGDRQCVGVFFIDSFCFERW